MDPSPVASGCQRPAIRFGPWLLLLLALLFAGSVRLRLLNLPLERDEGEYAYAGQLILQGIPPYAQVYNMKFPGVYYAYAVLMEIFGQTPRGIHEGILAVTSLSTGLVFLIGRRLLNPWGGGLAAIAFSGLSLVPMTYGLAGHATHFVVLFACAGLWTLLKWETAAPRMALLMAGIFFGMGILVLQHAAVFPLLAVVWLVWRKWQRRNVSWREVIVRAFICAAGCALPGLVMGMVLVHAGVWDRFCFWTLEYARQYVSLLPLQVAPRQFLSNFEPIFETSAGLWLLGLVGLALFWGRNQRARPAIMAALFFGAGMAATCPGFYFRGHYFLMALPGLALLDAVAVVWLTERFQALPVLRLLPAGLFILALGTLLVDNAGVWFEQTPFAVTRSLYDSNPFPESPEIAHYLQTHTAPDETVAVLGSEPQIYFLAGRHSASGYIYMYPLTEPRPLADKMRREFIAQIEAARPKYVVFVNLASSWLSVIKPGVPPDQSIPDWWRNYSQHYELVGTVDLAEGEPSVFHWGQEAARQDRSPARLISIFRRR